MFNKVKKQFWNTFALDYFYSRVVGAKKLAGDLTNLASFERETRPIEVNQLFLPFSSLANWFEIFFECHFDF
jgi:hypothetical protein